jgi:uncharacterized lipoprotein NlpE involved in copper resistance
MANFKGFKQVFKSEYEATANKVGYLWFVRENADSEMGEIYFGSRLYGKCSADFNDFYNKEEVDNLLAEYAKKTELEKYALVSLVEEIMGLIGIQASEESISLVLSESFEGAGTVVAALELLAGKLAAHEAVAEEKFAAIESKVNGLEVSTEVRKDGTYVVLKSGDDVISDFNANSFVVDGMLEKVELEGNVLVLTFNAESTKEPIRVPLDEMIKSYVFNNSQFTVDGTNVSLNEEYIKGLIAAAESGITVVEGNGITVNYTTNEEGAVVSVSAKVAENVEGNILAVNEAGLFAVLTISGEDVEA